MMEDMSEQYVHGYSEKESQRLSDQAGTLTQIIHHDSIFPPGSKILEAGCGTGAQTSILAQLNPGCEFTSVDISDSSLEIARKRISAAGITNVTFVHLDIMDEVFFTDRFDHAVFCFVLEHLKKPAEAVMKVMQMVKSGGTITAIEGDHGSVCFHPESEKALRTIECQVILQKMAGGDACIGRKIYPLLVSAGLSNVMVTARIVYADSGKSNLVDGFTRKTFIAMIEGVRKPSVAAGLITEKEWEEGISDLYRSAAKDGTFSYTFYKGTGIVP